MNDHSFFGPDYARLEREARERQARWDRHFYEDAQWVSRKSKDRSTRCGCVIVNDRQVKLTEGWNGFPRGVDDDVEERHARPAKYLWTEHAERNAIYNAASEGVALRGSTAYITGLPCSDCARALIQAGICRVVTQDVNTTIGMTDDTFEVAKDMLAEAGVVLDFVSIS